MSNPWEAPPMPEELEGWFDQETYWMEVERLAQWGLEQEALIQAGEVDAELGGLSQLTIDDHPYMDAESATMVMAWTNNPNAAIEGGLDYSAPYDAVEHGWQAVAGTWASAAMVTDVWDTMKELRGTENPPRHRARRNPLTDEQHGHLSRQARDTSVYYREAARKYGADGDPEKAAFNMGLFEYQQGKEAAHYESTHPYAYAADRSTRQLKRAAEEYQRSWASPNPPGTPYDGKWHRARLGTAQIYQMSEGEGMGTARVVPYTPRKSEVARGLAAAYEKQRGQKVPKGTKWILWAKKRTASRGIYGVEPLISAHKTLKAAKAAGDKALGVKRKRKRTRKNPPSSEFRAMLKTSSRSKASRVKLPKSAKAHKVNGKIVHRSVSNAGGRLRLIQGWTVSMPSGVGLARFKTKAAAERHARSL
jgi:hypothetical protein